MVRGLVANEGMTGSFLVGCLHRATTKYTPSLAPTFSLSLKNPHNTAYHVDLLVSNTVTKLTTLNIPVI